MLPAGFKPMLASAADLSAVKFPAICSVKLDGVRCLIDNGVAYSRNLKPIANRFVQEWIKGLGGLFDGHDGELIVGNWTEKDVFQKTISGVMSEDGEPDFLFWGFDRWDMPTRGYAARLKAVNEVCRLPFATVSSLEELMATEEKYVKEGFEGLMLRSLEGPYKNGRSTVREGYLLKVKRFSDAEAVIVGFQERMHNANEATTDNLGHTKRSSHKDNMIPMGTLGALIVQMPDGQTFKVGTGMDDLTRQEFWNNRESLLGKLVKYKYVEVGVKNLPRFPVYLGLRDANDLSE